MDRKRFDGSDGSFKAISVGLDGPAVGLDIYRNDGSETHVLLSKGEAVSLATKLLRMADGNDRSVWVGPDDVSVIGLGKS